MTISRTVVVAPLLCLLLVGCDPAAPNHPPVSERATACLDEDVSQQLNVDQAAHYKRCLEMSQLDCMNADGDIAYCLGGPGFEQLPAPDPEAAK